MHKVLSTHKIKLALVHAQNSEPKKKIVFKKKERNILNCVGGRQINSGSINSSNLTNLSNPFSGLMIFQYLLLNSLHVKIRKVRTGVVFGHIFSEAVKTFHVVITQFV